MNDTQTAWLAGLLEGEGAFMVVWKTNSGGCRYPTFKIACNLCDEDVLRRVYEWSGVGIFKGPTIPKNPKHSPFWRWSVNRRNDVFALCQRILPYMGERRAKRIQEVLDTISASEKPGWQHGTRWGYERGCRCELCRAAHAKHFRDRRARRRTELLARPLA